MCTIVRAYTAINVGKCIVTETDIAGIVKVKTVAISPIEADNLSIDDFDSADESVKQNLAK